MKLPADYHMHTPLCRHAVGEPVEYAAWAAGQGLEEIGFSDHAPMPRDDFDDWRMHQDQLAEYVARVTQARHTHPRLRIKLALEVDYLPGYEGWIRDLAARQPWDYLIGSVHYLGDWDIDNPRKLSRWQERDPAEVWRAYCAQLTRAAASGLFDIIGHADLAKKFAIYPAEDPGPWFAPFWAAARAAGVAIELNTAGLRKECREIYPSRALLEAAFAAGVPITFGSDAHAPEEVGADFDRALALARAVGYTRWVRFTQRRREEVPL